MTNYIEFLQIDGIDILLVNLLWKIDIESLDDLKNQNPEELLQKLNERVDLELDKKGLPSLSELNAILNEIKMNNKVK